MEDWTQNCRYNMKTITKNYGKRKGRIMFPTTHDITQRNVGECVKVLTKLLDAGNKVLITTKPDSKAMYHLRSKLFDYKDKDLVLLRYTITSVDNGLLRMFEPHAPKLEDRYKALQAAHKHGWKTSVSIEPYLDEDPIEVVKLVEPYVSDTIWIGVMSKPEMMHIPNGSPINPIVFAKRYNKVNISRFMRDVITAGKGKIRIKDSIKNMFSESTIKKWEKLNE